MATRGLVLYLLLGFSVAILSVLFVSHPNYNNSYQNGLTSTNLALPHSPDGSITKTVWPELEFSWRIVLATVIGFLGSACGTVGGVGGGGIFVPMLTLIVGFDTKSAAALSKCMIMGASASSVWYNLRVLHPTKEVPIIDYDLALLFQPMLMLGITIGVALSVIFPYWLITVLIIFLFLGTSSRSFFKGIEMWKEETVLKKEIANRQETVVNSRAELLIDTQYEPLVPREEKTQVQILCLNLRWKRILVLLFVWNDVAVCSAWYWVLFFLQFPIALGVFGYEAVKLYREHKKRKRTGNAESICEASIEWTAMHIAFCSLCGILGGTVGGLLGSGGGFILGPLLLEIGVIPQHIVVKGFSRVFTEVTMKPQDVQQKLWFLFTGGKCNSNICHDVLFILVRGGVLPSQEVPYSLCSIPHVGVCFSWLLGTVLHKKTNHNSWKSINYYIHSLWRHLS
ncbi:hypothetical protein I3843_10G003400 [Carya illinoinensis]|nr:hypothetical protein I3843_10G003400 [Carya illinoinensis]KAG7958121.1 hypothetical protein I3843_10G003400 [Carya illinoinensis]